MKNESLSKILKVSMIVAILLVGISAFYYFVVFLPEQQTQDKERDFLFSMKQECQKAGDKLYQADVKSSGENSLFVPEYAYNKSLNTCLYFGGYVAKDWINKWVKDSFTNEEIISFMRSGEQVILGSACPSCLSNEAFDERKRELFNE